MKQNSMILSTLHKNAFMLPRSVGIDTWTLVSKCLSPLTGVFTGVRMAVMRSAIVTPKIVQRSTCT